MQKKHRANKSIEKFQEPSELINNVDFDVLQGAEFKQGGDVDTKQPYAKWKGLVNMSKSELKEFYDSKEGKEAGLKASEAKAQGIDSGRESARWIYKMKSTPVAEWTPAMWKWANKQISFISRMKGVKGKLYDDKGNKTRKHTALLIWGHNPEKYNVGGKIRVDISKSEADKILSELLFIKRELDKNKNLTPMQIAYLSFLKRENKIKVKDLKLGSLRDDLYALVRIIQDEMDKRYESLNLVGFKGRLGEKYAYHFTTLFGLGQIIEGNTVGGNRLSITTNPLFGEESTSTVKQYDNEKHLLFSDLEVKIVFDLQRLRKNAEIEYGSYKNKGTHFGEYELIVSDVKGNLTDYIDWIEFKDLASLDYDFEIFKNKKYSDTTIKDELLRLKITAKKRENIDVKEYLFGGKKPKYSEGGDVGSGVGGDVKSLTKVLTDLQSNNIEYDAHEGNFGLKDGKIILFDVEDWNPSEKIKDEVESMPIEDIDYLNNPNYTLIAKGESSQGNIYLDNKTGRVVKVTKSWWEAFGSLRQMNEKMNGIVTVHSVKRIGENTFLIEKDFVDMLPKDIQENMGNIIDAVSKYYNKEKPISVNKAIATKDISKAVEQTLPTQLKVGGGVGGNVEKLIERGVVDLEFYNTTSEHASLYGFKSTNPLYVKRIFVNENYRNKGIGSDVLQYLHEYAKENNHDLIFGHIEQKSEPSIGVIKSLLKKNGYSTIKGNNDFYKYIDANISKKYIMQNKSLFANGYFFDMRRLSNMIDPYGQVPLNLDFTLISYNSGGQNNLNVIDTINATILADKLCQLCDLSKSQSYVVVNYFIDNAERLINIKQIKTEKIVIVDRDNIVCENIKYNEGGEVLLLAPNGKRSNLTPEQYKLVRTTAFKKWFGDWENDAENASKVIDDNGEPLICYHGTSAKFNVFRDFDVKRSTMGNSVGFYFTPSEWSASRRSAMGDYIKVFLNIKNLVYLKKFSSDYDFISILGEEVKLAKGLPDRAETYWFLKNGSAYRGLSEDNVGDVVKALSLKKGIDGYYFTEFMSAEEGVVPVYVVFSSENVKLADGTNTTFDGNNPDIRFDDGGMTDFKFKNKNNETGNSRAEGKTSFSKSKAAPKEVRYNGTDAITSRGRSQSDKDDARRLAKEKVKNDETNFSLQSAIRYNKSVGLPDIKHHKYKKSDAFIQTEISDLYPKLIGVDSPDYKQTSLERNIYMGYKKEFPSIISDYKIKNYKDLVNKAYAQLVLEVDKQYKGLPVHVSYHNGDMNYENSADMMDDIHNFGHLWVYKGGEDHPKLGSKTTDSQGLTANEKFRAVHDYYGHSVEGYQFGKDGEENAWIEHSKMLSPLAQWALSTETRGQNSYVNYSGINAAILETIKIGSELKKIGFANGNENMVKDGQDLLDTVYDVFIFAEQKAILLPVRYTNTSNYGGLDIKTIPTNLNFSNMISMENGGLVNDACIEEAIRIINHIMPIRDWFIVENKLIIIFKYELSGQDIELMSEAMGRFTICHSVINPEALLNYDGSYKTIYFMLKKSYFSVGDYSIGGFLNLNNIQDG